jgi:hypothetical protein
VSFIEAMRPAADLLAEAFGLPRTVTDHLRAVEVTFSYPKDEGYKVSVKAVGKGSVSFEGVEFKSRPLLAKALTGAQAAGLDKIMREADAYLAGNRAGQLSLIEGGKDAGAQGAAA